MCKSSVHSYQRSILTAEVVHLFTFGFVGVRDSFSIWILPPAVYFYRRSELTEDVYILSTFLFQALLFGWQTSPSILTLRDFAAASPVYSYGAYATFPFLYFRFHHHERFHFIVTRDSNSLLLGLQIIITRDYKSLLREITNHYYERLQIIITRDYKSLLREITNHYYSDYNSLLLGLQIIITRDYKSLLLGLQIIVTRDYKSLLREITLHYLNYTPAVHIHRRSEFTEDSFFLSTHTTSSVHSHSPRLRRRFAGPFLRRLCDPIHPSSGDRIWII
jgi:hypothetical protein